MLTKDFPTDQVLSAITGVLICDIGGIHEVLDWMTGDSVFTHQLPRIGREATPVVLAAHPELFAAIGEAELVNRDNWQFWRQKWIDRYGPTIAVPKFNADQHECIDPISELAEIVPPDRIVMVKP